MSNKKGFTLTEVLLGVMIVGIIGISLAALTTSATRDSGLSNSRIMLRNNLSIFMRQLRQDVHEASNVISIPGALNSNQNALLLTLVKNQAVSGETLGSGSVLYTTYCYKKSGSADACTGIEPDNACIGGQIRRLTGSTNNADSCVSSGKVVLNNVKFVPSTEYAAPLFTKEGTMGSILKVHLIVELPSTPIVNDAVEELFVLPNGF